MKQSKRRRKYYGQHMLTDEKILQYEVDMLRPEGKVVLEIGGGTGNLTKFLLDKAKHVITIEKDLNMAEQLKDRFEERKNFTLINADFLELNQKKIEEEAGMKIDLIAGNVPYSVTSQIVFKFVEYDFENALLCVQKEFAERLVSEPGERDHSRLSVMASLYFKPTFLKKVNPGSFKPVPEVDSAIIMLRKTGEKVDLNRDKFIERLFSHRKNTLGAAMKSREMKEYKKVIEKIKALGIEKLRVYHLTIKDIKEILS